MSEQIQGLWARITSVEDSTIIPNTKEAASMKVVAGIDVGKTSLDVSMSAGPVRRFDHTPELGGMVDCEGVIDVVCESMGAMSGLWCGGCNARRCRCT